MAKAKGKTTTYNQTIKGHPAAAATHKRQANLLGRLITARKQGQTNLAGQYTNARARNLATRKSVVGDLLAGFNTAKEGYERSNTDAEANLGATTSASALNRAREGSNAMSELSNMQAGETDRIKGMSASIRAMKANMDNGASDYATAMTSINNSLGDLNTNVTSNINNALANRVRRTSRLPTRSPPRTPSRSPPARRTSPPRRRTRSSTASSGTLRSRARRVPSTRLATRLTTWPNCRATSSPSPS
jgi:uncharacterized phage infection (PIP) family protein YhgE